MRIVRVDDGAVIRLQIQGELDLATVDAVTFALSNLLSGKIPEKVVVDLAGLTFCDSSGIDALIGAREMVLAAGAGFKVVRARGIVRRAMVACGVHDLLTAGKTQLTA